MSGFLHVFRFLRYFRSFRPHKYILPREKLAFAFICPLTFWECRVFLPSSLCVVSRSPSFCILLYPWFTFPFPVFLWFSMFRLNGDSLYSFFTPLSIIRSWLPWGLPRPNLPNLPPIFSHLRYRGCRPFCIYFQAKACELGPPQLLQTLHRGPDQLPLRAGNTCKYSMYVKCIGAIKVPGGKKSYIKLHIRNSTGSLVFLRTTFSGPPADRTIEYEEFYQIVFKLSRIHTKNFPCN